MDINGLPVFVPPFLFHYGSLLLAAIYCSPDSTAAACSAASLGKNGSVQIGFKYI